VLDGRPFTRIGGTRELCPSVRVVAATNRDLSAQVAAGAFRQDLYYRLSTVALRVPPLRERREEIAPLSTLFLQRANQRFERSVTMIAPQAMARLQEHAWPGNIRQLRNVIEAAVLCTSGRVLGPASIAHELEAATHESPGALDDAIEIDPARADYRTQVRHFETALILAALRKTGGNHRKAAALLGLPKRTLFHRIRLLDIRQIFVAEQQARASGMTRQV